MPTSLFAFWVGDKVAPQAEHQKQETENSMVAFSLQASPTVAANKVFTYQNYSFHVREIRKDPGGDPNRLQLVGVTIYENPTEPRRLSRSDHRPYRRLQPRHLDAARLWCTTFWTRTVRKLYEVAGKPMILNLHVPLTDLAQSGSVAPEELTIAQLHSQMDALASTGQSGTDAYRAIAFGYYAKYALPFVCLAFALVAPPLALRFARTGAYIGIFISIILVWVGWNTLLSDQVPRLVRQTLAGTCRLVPRPAVRHTRPVLSAADRITSRLLIQRRKPEDYAVFGPSSY